MIICIFINVCLTISLKELIKIMNMLNIEFLFHSGFLGEGVEEPS